jgi:hypothetical protein
MVDGPLLPPGRLDAAAEERGAVADVDGGVTVAVMMTSCS